MKASSFSIIVLLILLIVLVLLGFIWLITSQKQNREFEKKPVLFYAFVSLLIFCLTGFLGNLDQDKLSDIFGYLQMFIIFFGLIHSFLLFRIFEWASRSSFGKETLLTVLICLTGAIGFIIIFWPVNYFMNPAKGGDILLMVNSLFWFVIPYLILRTFDYYLLIPGKTYNVWQFPLGKSCPMQIDPHIFVNIHLSKEASFGKWKNVLERPRMPLSGDFGNFFHRFVELYNTINTLSPIKDLNQTDSGNRVGWVFFVSDSLKGKKRLINAKQIDSSTLHQEQPIIYIEDQEINEGDTIHAERRILDEGLPPPPISNCEEAKKSDSDDFFGGDGIIITEK